MLGAPGADPVAMRIDQRHRLQALPFALAAALAIACLLLAAPGIAAAKGERKSGGELLPPKGKIFAGVSDTGQGSDYREYRDATGAHPAVMQSFESWGNFPGEALRRWRETRTRGMLSLSTSRCWGCEPEISTGSIAKGKGDRYILKLAKGLAKRKRPTYIRLFPEMNGHWNGYSAFGGAGHPRGSQHSTKNFIRAWKRFTLIVRGGKRKAVDKKLRKLGMPKIKAKTKRSLPKPKVAIAWVPQSTGSPDVPGNAPADYFPGNAYLDWVGADIYGKYPNFGGLDALYRKYAKKKPFMIGEWAPWGADDPQFVSTLAKWIAKHKRARMAVYYQGFGEGAANPFEVGDYPRSTEVLRRTLEGKRFAPYAAEERKSGSKGNGKRGKSTRGGRR
ncbi:MAG: hypothetical protein ACR2K6_11740 [Solirubrobacterales bacterium]